MDHNPDRRRTLTLTLRNPGRKLDNDGPGMVWCLPRCLMVTMLTQRFDQWENNSNGRVRRHGDKGREMQLVSFSSYVEAAEKLITENPLNYKRIGFVSSEDQTVIDDAGNLTRIDTGLQCHHACLSCVF